MRAGKALVWMVWFAACGDPDAPTDSRPPHGETADTADADTDTDADSDTDADTDVDSAATGHSGGVITPPLTAETGPPPDSGPRDSGATGDTGSTLAPTGEGSMVLVQYLPTSSGGATLIEHTQLYGLFGSTLDGILDAAACYPVPASPCIDTLPAVPGTSVDLSGSVLDPVGILWLDMGPQVWLGPYSADRKNDAQGAVHYHSSSMQGYLGGVPLGVRLDGSGPWGAYDGVADVLTPAQLDVLAPDPIEPLVLRAGGTVDFSWTPAAAGDVWLLVGDPAPRLFLLDDAAGSFTLSVDELGLIFDGPVQLSLLRTSRGQAVANGHPIDVVVRSQQVFTASYDDMEGRELIAGAADCASAQTLPDLVPGRYYGTMAGGGSNLDPPLLTCLLQPAAGSEVLFKVGLARDERLTAVVDVLGQNTAAYVLRNCNFAGSCLAAAEDHPFGPGPETVMWDNTGLPSTGYLVVDQASGSGDVFHLDVDIREPYDEGFPNTCAEARTAPGVTEGWHQDRVLGADPSVFPNCLLASGRDRIVPIDVPAGATVRITSPEFQSYTLYLVDECSDPNPCLDQSAVGPHELEYENATASSRRVFLVLDEPLPLLHPRSIDFRVEFAFGTPEPLPDTCADARSTAPLPPGITLSTMVGHSADLTPSPGTCSMADVDGVDAISRVTVNPDEVLHASVSDENLSVYVLKDCDALGSCGTPRYGSSAVYHHQGAASAEVFVVVDAAPGALVGPFSLTLWTESGTTLAGFTQLPGALSCDQAALMPPLTEGSWWGAWDDAPASFEPLAGCVPLDPDTREVRYRVELPPGKQLVATAAAVGDVAVLYVLGDCEDRGSCLYGDDAGQTNGSAEVRYANTGLETESVVLVVDSRTEQVQGSLFTLDVELRDVAPIDLPETCAQAEAQAYLTELSLQADLSGRTDDIAPPAGACVGLDSDGGDVVAKLLAAAHELIEVEDLDPEAHLYLMGDCSDPATCDAPGPQTPSEVSWLNEGAVPQDVFLVVDHPGAPPTPGVVDLSLERSIVQVPLASDTCAAARTEGALGAGIWHGTLRGKTATFGEPAPSSCTEQDTQGAEVFYRIPLGPGNEVTVDVKTPGVVPWLVLDCDVPTSCVAPTGGAGDNGPLRYINATAGQLDVFLVVDDDSAASVSTFEVEVHIEGVAPLNAADSCSDVGALAPIGAGNYAGDSTGYVDDLDPGSLPGSCTTDLLDGPDTMVPVHLEPGEALLAEVSGAADAAYLVHDCQDPATCFSSGHATTSVGPAALFTRNAGLTPLDAVLVVDAVGGVGGPIGLDYHQGPAVDTALPNDCVEALLAPSLTTGRTWIAADLSAHSNDLDPTGDDCTGYGAPGRDAVLPITLLPQETLTATYKVLGSPSFPDGALLLLSTCGDPSSCVVGQDLLPSEGNGVEEIHEEIRWRNQSASPRSVFLALDGYTDATDVLLTVHIE